MYASPNITHATSATQPCTEVLPGKASADRAMVAILFSTPTSVKVVALTRFFSRQPVYEMPTPMKHDNRSQRAPDGDSSILLERVRTGGEPHAEAGSTHLPRSRCSPMMKHNAAVGGRESALL